MAPKEQIVIVDGASVYVVSVPAASMPPKARKPPKINKRKIPRALLEGVPPKQRRPLQSAVKATGGWDDGAACGETSRKPRKTFASAKKFAREIEDETGLDFGAMDPAPLKDPFCKPLELKGARCPDTLKKGGVSKAVRIGLGSKNRRLADLPNRPQWQVLQDALAETQGVTLHPNALEAVLQHNAEVSECKPMHSDRRAELLDEAKRGKLKPRARSKVPF